MKRFFREHAHGARAIFHLLKELWGENEGGKEVFQRPTQNMLKIAGAPL